MTKPYVVEIPDDATPIEREHPEAPERIVTKRPRAPSAKARDAIRPSQPNGATEAGRSRSPSTCGGRAVLASDRSHKAFWQKRYTVNSEIWKAAKAEGLEADYKVAEARMKQAAAVLEQMRRGTKA